MSRIVIGIEYIGTYYSGWQKQNGTERTIQYQLEKAIEKVASHPVSLYCSGRTDSGVHARCQVAHFDSEASRSSLQWKLGINSHLHNDIRVMWVEEQDYNFHARYSAYARLYHYYISTNRELTVFNRPFCWNIPYALDVEAMQQTAKIFIGTHDFSSFRARKCQAKSPNKHIYCFNVLQKGTYIQIEIKANSFLYNMVRNLVGMLFMVGSKRKDRDWAQSLLQSSDNLTKAPAHGLYFMQPFYHNIDTFPIVEVFPHFTID